MKTKPKYFPITINASSPEELAARIADNELRGFELVTSAMNENNEGYAANSSYVDSEGVIRRYKVDSVTRKYQAAMRRENCEFKGIDEELIRRFELP